MSKLEIFIEQHMDLFYNVSAVCIHYDHLRRYREMSLPFISLNIIPHSGPFIVNKF